MLSGMKRALLGWLQPSSLCVTAGLGLQLENRSFREPALFIYTLRPGCCTLSLPFFMAESSQSPFQHQH